MAGMREFRLIPWYFGVDLELVWKVVGFTGSGAPAVFEPLLDDSRR